MADTAEKTDPKTGIANTKLLVVALVLGVLATVLFNVQIYRARMAGKGDTEWVLQYAVDRQASDAISTGDLKEVEIDTKFAKGLGNYVSQKDRKSVAGQRLSQSVLKGQWVLWHHITASSENNPSAKIRREMRKYSFAVDPDHSPMEKLAEGDRVDVYGMFSINKADQKAYLIVEDLKVMEKPTRRKVTVEVTPEMSGQLANIETNAMSPLWITVRNPTERARSTKINADLRDMSALPDVRRRR